MNRYLEKKIRRWVLATIDPSGISYYMYRKPQSSDYQLVTDISQALKFTSKSTAELALDFYLQEMGRCVLFAPIPIDITYEIVEE